VAATGTGEQRGELLLRLARNVTARHEVEDVLAEALRSLRSVVDFDGGSIQLLDDEGFIQMAAADPVAPAHVMAQRVPLGASVAGRVILTEQPVYLRDISSGPGSDGGKRVSEGVRSYLGVPLVADGAAIGLLQIDSSTADAWSPADRETLVAAAPIVAAAIQNARAYARADLARLAAEASEARLANALRLVSDAQAAVASGDRDELASRLNDLAALLNGAGPLPPFRFPMQKATSCR
jgi:GAF domain-containing protein